MKILSVCILLLVGSQSWGFLIEHTRKLYIGARAGNVSMTGNAAKDYANGIGYGLDLGLKEPIRNVDFFYTWQLSPHSGLGGLNLQVHSVSAEFHPLELNDLDVTLGIGSGLYLYQMEMGSQMRFGINLGASAALIISNSVHLGVASRFHAASRSPVPGNFFTMMVRLGYSFHI